MSGGTPICRNVGLATALLLPLAVLAQAPEAAPAKDAKEAIPATPEVRLAPITGFDDDDAYASAMAKQAEDLAARARQTSGVMAKLKLQLAAANLILAQQLEPDCSRAFLRLAGAIDPHDRDRIRAALDRADALLADADQGLRLLAPEREPDSPPDVPDPAADLFRYAETLKAFFQAQRAYLLDRAEPDAAARMRRAASALATLLEDSNRQVSSAATLWLATLRSAETDLEPALSALEPALAHLPAEGMPHAFFARLLRCRLIAARGGFAAAVAMLLQMEERINTWFKDPAQRDDALRTCALVRLQIITEWHDRLPAATQSAERQWCCTATKRIQGEQFNNARTVLRLAPAIPLLVPPPDRD